MAAALASPNEEHESECLSADSLAAEAWMPPASASQDIPAQLQATERMKSCAPDSARKAKKSVAGLHTGSVNDASCAFVCIDDFDASTYVRSCQFTAERLSDNCNVSSIYLAHNIC